MNEYILLQIGGVPTNFRMPDVPSIGLGGGSIVSVTEDSGKVRTYTIFSSCSIYIRTYSCVT